MIRHEGFHGRAGFGRRPALVVVDVNRGFTDPASPLVCELDGVVQAIRRLIDGFRDAGLPVVFMSGYDSRHVEVGGRLLEKPVTEQRLLETIREVLDEPR